jgi:hypothetical protein
MPTSISRTENVASAEQYRRSHAVTMSTPAPMHAPWIAAITGLRQRSMAVTVSCIRGSPPQARVVDDRRSAR